MTLDFNAFVAPEHRTYEAADLAFSPIDCPSATPQLDNASVALRIARLMQDDFA